MLFRSPSSNRSGRPSPTTARHVIEDMDGRVEMIIDGGDTQIGLESTIIDLTGGKPEILRPGSVTEEMVKEAIGNVETQGAVPEDGAAPKAPGMKYRHYAPRGELTIVEGAAGRVISFINGQLELSGQSGKRTGVIATDETEESYRADSVKSVGKRADEARIARRIFRILREFDDEGIEVIYAESFENTGLGCAIMNRLLKAAGHRVIRLDEDREDR